MREIGLSVEVGIVERHLNAAGMAGVKYSLHYSAVTRGITAGYSMTE